MGDLSFHGNEDSSRSLLGVIPHQYSVSQPSRPRLGSLTVTSLQLSTRKPVSSNVASAGVRVLRCLDSDHAEFCNKFCETFLWWLNLMQKRELTLN